jgi:hypothetical protein
MVCAEQMLIRRTLKTVFNKLLGLGVRRDLRAEDKDYEQEENNQQTEDSCRTADKLVEQGGSADGCRRSYTDRICFSGYLFTSLN